MVTKVLNQKTQVLRLCVTAGHQTSPHCRLAVTFTQVLDELVAKVVSVISGLAASYSGAIKSEWSGMLLGVSSKISLVDVSPFASENEAAELL